MKSIPTRILAGVDLLIQYRKTSTLLCKQRHGTMSTTQKSLWAAVNNPIWHIISQPKPRDQVYKIRESSTMPQNTKINSLREYLGHRCKTIYWINNLVWGVTKGLLLQTSSVLDWEEIVTLAITHPASGERIHSLLLEQQLDHLLSRVHRGDMQDIVVVLQR